MSAAYFTATASAATGAARRHARMAELGAVRTTIHAASASRKIAAAS
jgi:hypothetical protein